MKKAMALSIMASFLLCACGGGGISAYSESYSSDIALKSETEEDSLPLLSSSEENISEEETRSSSSSSSFLPEESSETSADSVADSSSESLIEFPDDYDYSKAYGGYYSSLVSWENGEDLKSQLHEIIHGGSYSPIPYGGSVTNWFSNQNADQFLYDHEFLDVVYSRDNVDKNSTNSGWQREHAFCASLMTGTPTGNAVKTLGRATDFHNLFASGQSGNSSRGNKNFGMANKADETYIDRTTSGGEDGYSSDHVWFEPGDKDKGRLARAIFYMATMYCEDEYDSYNGVLMKGLQIVEESVPYLPGKDCLFAIGGLSDLLKWSENSVDLQEFQHNESVFSFVPQIYSNPSENHAQGNRNPYVDFPGLVDYAFGEKKDEAGRIDDLIPSSFTLSMEEGGVAYYAISSAKRQYDEDDVFEKEDVSIVSVNKDFTETRFDDFSVSGAAIGEKFEKGGTKELVVSTPINDIPYEILVETDPISSADWHHDVTAKSKGNDFEGIAAEAGVVHTIDFSGVDFDVVFASGGVQSNSSKLGCKFGTNSVPVGTLSFESTNAFEFGDKNRIKGVFIRGAAAAGCSYDIDYYIDGLKIFSSKLGYPGQDLTEDVGSFDLGEFEGRLSIVIANITSAVYIKSLAVHLL